MGTKRIFVSATSRDLGSYRLVASATLRELGYEVDDQAIFNLTFLEIGEKIKHRIQSCDAVVCLIGFVYGGEPAERLTDQPRRSYTQWEYHFAHELKKPVYLLLADEQTKFDPHDLESDEVQQLQLRYRAAVIRDRDWRPFANVDQLRAELALLRFPWEGPPRDHKPNNLLLPSIGTLFKGREAFLNELRHRLGVPRGRATAIVSRQAVHGLGGVGKTRSALEYAWRYCGEYTALLFVSAPSVAELRANLGNLVGVLGTTAAASSVDQQLDEVLRWLDAHPGWLLIVDSVDTDEAAREVELLLHKLRAGHVLITSRISNWSPGVEPLELHVLAPADAQEFLLDRTPRRRQSADDAARADAIARELDGLALALEQAGAYIDKLRLSFAEYLQRWEAKRPEVLGWHDLRLMQYPASVAVTWETTFAQLIEPEQRLLEVLAWLAPEPIPEFLFEAAPLRQAIPDIREALAGLAGYSLVRFETAREAFLVHRLVQEITRGRWRRNPSSKIKGLLQRLVQEIAYGWWVPAAESTSALQVAVAAVDAVSANDPQDIRTWGVWTLLAAHVETVARHADAAKIAGATARLMDRLGLYLSARGQFRAAEPLFRRALAIDEGNSDPDHPTVAIRLNNVAELLRATNRMHEAEPLFRRALAIDERSYGPDHPSVAIKLTNLGMLLFQSNRSTEAEPLMRRALSIVEHSYGPDHPNLGVHLNNLAGLLQETNRLDEAEPLFRRALAISEAAYGPDHPLVAVHLNNLASLLKETNRLDEAEPLFRRALAIHQHSHDPDHPFVASGLNNLGDILQLTNRLGEAESLFRRALVIHEHSYGPDHPNVGTCLGNLAGLLLATNRLDEAEPLFRRALAIHEDSYGRDHPGVARDLNNLGLLLRDTGRLSEAEPLIRRALAIDEHCCGPDHPGVARDLNNLGLLLRDTDRLCEVEPLIRRALAIDEHSYGPDHPNVGVRLNNLGDLLQSTNRLPEAEPLFRRALAIDERSYGPDHPSVAIKLTNLGMLLFQSNRSTEAEPLMRRALSIVEASFGADHANVLVYLYNLGLLLRATNRSAEAEQLSRRYSALTGKRVLLSALPVLIEINKRSGQEDPRLRILLARYRDILEQSGQTPDEIERQVHELMGPVDAEGT
jgi:tetratricopeptide (TPR) repeat protein